MIILECGSLAAKWKQLSGFIGLSSTVIDQIRCDHPNDSSCCWNEALNQWIKQNYNTEKFGKPSWQTLLGAVVHVDRRLFEKLASEHKLCQYSPPTGDHSVLAVTSNHPSPSPSQIQVSKGEHNKIKI